MVDIRKNVVETGESSGIGLAAVSHLLRSGFSVGIFGSSNSNIESSRDQLREAGHLTDAFMAPAVNLREHQQIKDFLDGFAEEFGSVGVLVNNAGISPKLGGKKIPPHKTSLELWLNVLNVSLTAAFVCARHVLPNMMKAKFGRIVMDGSIATRDRPVFAGGAYVSSKAGLSGLAHSIAAEYASYGITANTVAPGNVATEITGGPGSPQNVEASRNIPVGRLGVPDDFSGLIALFARNRHPSSMAQRLT